MTDENNNNKPTRRRRTLIKKDEKDEDVLKKLKEVRQNLQDSLKEDITGSPATPPEIKTPTPKQATSQRGERRLFKKEDFAAPEEGKKGKKKPIKKPIKKVSQKRMARVNARVQARMDKLKGLSRQKKAIIIVWAVLMTVPLVFLTTLSVIGLEFNFTDFGLTYNENKPGTVMLSFGVRNPSFLPAQLGVFELDLYSEDGKYIGKATNNDFLSVMPYETKTLYVTLAFNEEEGGKWWSDWLGDLVLSLNIGTLTYNGIAVDASAVPPIELDTGPIIRDMITGLLDLDELIGGLDLGSMLPGGEEEPVSAGAQVKSSSEKIILDPYTNAKRDTLYDRLMPKLSQFDDIGGNLSFAMSENDEEFNFGLGATFGLGDLVSAEDLMGITLGPIKMNNLDVQLVVNTEKDYEDVQAIEDDEDWWTHYNKPIAKLFSTAQNEIYIADPRDRSSIFAMNLTIFKDDPKNLVENANGVEVHPSALIDWEAPATSDNSIQSFLAGTGEVFGEYDVAWKEFPSWHFLYNLLSEGGLDCGILINNVDINIFGLDIKDLSIPMEVLPPLALDDGTLDPDNFLKIAPDYGLAGMLKHFEKSIIETPAMAFLGLPPSTSADDDTSAETEEDDSLPGLPPEKDLNEFLDDFIGMVEFPSIDPFEDIEESFGKNASLHIGLPLTLNNSMLNLYMGFEGMQISIASDSDTSDTYKDVLLLTLKGSNSDTVYIPGIGSMVDIMVSVDILKNETIQPHAAKLLRSLIEDWTLDGVITAKFDKLVLFKENYTYGKFDIAIPLVLELEDILIDLIGELVPGLIGGLVGDATELDARNEVKMSPIALLYSLWSPLPSLLGVASKSDALLKAAGSNYLESAQDEEEEVDAMSGMINDLINDLIGGVLGDALGSEMEFKLGFNATVSEGKWTKFTIHIGDFYVDDFFLTLGLGDTDIRLQSKNKYGEWEDLVGIEVDNYFEIKAQKKEDIIVSIKIYETQALSDFISDFVNEFFDPKKTNTLDLKVAGSTTLNLSGIYIPDLNIELALEDMDTGLQGTDLIDGLFDMIYDLELDGENEAPQLLNLWSGPFSRIPFVSQSLDLESLIHIGEISIDDISESHFSNISKGVGQIKLTIGSSDDPTVNYLMSMDIKKLVISLYDLHPANDVNAKRLLDISIDDGVGLDYASNRQLEITITIYKSEECESFLNSLINTLELDGWLNFSAELDVFGTNIEIKPTYLPAINMSRLPIDVTELLAGVLNPLAAPFLSKTTGPKIAQNINTDSIFENVLKFGIGKISLGEFDNDVGSLNYDDPAMTVNLMLWIQTFFNMSIRNLDLKLLDGGLYKSLHVDGGFDFDDVVKEAEIARIVLNGGAAHFNSTIPGTTTHDPQKPYIVNKTGDFSYDDGEQRWKSGADFDDRVQFEVDRNKLDDDVYPYRRDLDNGLSALEFNQTGFTDDNYLYLESPTLNELNLEVQLYNKSHGSWEDRYERRYWRALGGPYFPPQRYGREYGGYPDHYYIYHKYYSPLASLVEKAVKLLDENGIAADSATISDLISGIAIAGSINVTVFSMDININLNNKINSLIEPIAGLFLGLTGVAIKDYLNTVVNPFAERVAPKQAFINDVMLSQDIGDLFGDILDFEVIPVETLSVFHGITFPGILDRSDHNYNTNQRGLWGKVRTWDGAPNWVEDPNLSGPEAYKATESEAVYEDYTTDPEDITSYKGGLTDSFFDNKENFYHDHYYEKFKTVVDNYYTSTGRKYNPFFETYYSKVHPYTGKVDYMGQNTPDWDQKIEDPKEWPLRYNEEQDGRCKTAFISFHIGLMLEIPVGILAGSLDMYLEDPTRACLYMPYGYIFFNSSVKVMEMDQILQDEYVVNHFNDIMQYISPKDDNYADLMHYYNTEGTLGADDTDIQNNIMGICACGVNGTQDYGHQPSPTGKLENPGWTLQASIRMFEGIGAREFFNVLVGSLLDEVPLIVQGFLNISLLGYEFYNIYLPKDLAQLGDPTSFYERCEEYLEGQSQGGGLGNIGIPSLNGTATGDIQQDPSYQDLWPHYLLIGDPIALDVAFPFEAILPFNSLLAEISDLSNILDIVSLGIGFHGLSMYLWIRLELTGLVVYLELSLSEIYVYIDVDLPNLVPVMLWLTQLTVTLNLGYQETGWQQETYKLEIKAMQPTAAMDVRSQSHPNRRLDDPYDFRYNSYEGFTIPNFLVTDIEKTIGTGDLLGGLLTALFSGESLIFNINIGLDILIPAGLDYTTYLDLGLDDLGDFGL